MRQQPRCARIEKIAAGPGRRIQQRVERCIFAVLFAAICVGRAKIAVQIDVVLVNPAQPRRAIRVQHVDEHDRRIFAHGGQAVGEPLELNGRTRVALDAVQARRMHEHAPRGRRPEPPDVYGEILAVRRGAGDLQAVEPAAARADRVAKTPPRRREIGGKVQARAAH